MDSATRRHGCSHPAPACTAITVAKGAACFHDLASATELLSGSENWSLVSRGMLSLARGTEGYAEFVFARHRIDEALFFGGLDKGEFLRAFGADFFFDDQRTHVESAARHVAAGHVPHGVANE